MRHRRVAFTPPIPYRERCPDCGAKGVLLPLPDGRRLCVDCRAAALRRGDSQ